MRYPVVASHYRTMIIQAALGLHNCSCRRIDTDCFNLFRSETGVSSRKRRLNFIASPAGD